MRVGLLAAALCGFAAVTVDVRATAGVTVIGFLVLNGLLVNRLGELSWHGGSDAVRLTTLVAAAVLGLTGAAAYRIAGRLRAWRLWSARRSGAAATVWSGQEARRV